VVLRKLRAFQRLGHKVVFIVGDFTGLIGDTSDKDSERPMLTRETIETNMRHYTEQAGKIIDLDKAEIHYNSTWLEKLSFREIGEQADCFSVAEFIARDNIRRRLDAGTRVSLREMLYPLMQGYDSVAIRSHAEVMERFSLGSQRDLRLEMKNIRAGVLFVSGSRDNKFCELAKIMQENTPRSSLRIFENAGHRVPWDVVDFKNVALEFFNKGDGSESRVDAHKKI
jgi:hypothetical protein